MEITVKAKDLLSVITEVMLEAERIGAEGIEVSINENQLYFAVIECGGFGYIGDFDAINGLTKEEILDLP